MKEKLSVSATSSLPSGPMPIPYPNNILSGFLGGAAKVVRFEGPHRFYRAAGWDSSRNEMVSA